MFGNVVAFVNGNMFCGLFRADLGMRLTDPDDRTRLAEAGGGPFGPDERPMGGYLSLPASWRVMSHRRTAAPSRGLAGFVRSMPVRAVPSSALCRRWPLDPCPLADTAEVGSPLGGQCEGRRSSYF
jgi:hypothetical protein